MSDLVFRQLSQFLVFLGGFSRRGVWRGLAHDPKCWRAAHQSWLYVVGAGCRCKHHWEWTCRPRGGAAVCLDRQVHGVPQQRHRHAIQSWDYHVGRCRYMRDGQNQPCGLWAWCSAAPAWAGSFMHHPCLSGGGGATQLAY